MRRYVAILCVVMAVGTAASLLPSSGAAQERPRQGGTLTVAWNIIGVGSLDPRDARATFNWLAGKHLFDPFARLNPKTGQPIPALAKSWTVSPDGRTITYVLREDVVFHDGTRFDAEAVKFNLDRFAEKDSFIRGLMGGDDYVGTEVIGPFSVRITWRRPQGFWWDIQAYRIGFHSPAAVRAGGPEYGIRTVSGTGPFKLVRYVERQELVLERNPQYRWGSAIYKHTGPAYLDQLIFRTITEPTTRLSALERGEVQFIEGQQLQHVYAEWSKKPGYAGALNLKAGTTRALHINASRAPLTDVRLRRAIAHAINRQVLVDLPRYSGLARVAYGTIAGKNWEPGNLDEFKAFNYPYNPQRARQLLDEAGWRPGPDGIAQKDGRPLAFDNCHNIGDATQERVQQVIQAMLRQAGMNMEIRNFSATAYGAIRARGECDTLFHRWIVPATPLLSVFYAADAVPPNGLNQVFYLNAEITEIIKEAEGTVDQPKAKALFWRAQEILARDLPTIPIYYLVGAQATTARLSGLVGNPTNDGDGWNSEVWKLGP